MQDEFFNKRKKGRDFVGHRFSGVKVPHVQAEQHSGGNGPGQVKIIGADHVVFRTEAEKLALHAVFQLLFGIINTIYRIEAFEQQFRWNPGWQDPEVREMMEDMVDVLVPMIVDLSNIRSPLPRGVSGFLEAVGVWLSSPLGALAGWLFYGDLVLIAVNLLGGSAKLPEFLGMVSLYVIPGLLCLFGPIP